MKDNAEDLAKLCTTLEELKTNIDHANTGANAAELKDRLSQTSWYADSRPWRGMRD